MPENLFPARARYIHVSDAPADLMLRSRGVALSLAVARILGQPVVCVVMVFLVGIGAYGIG